MRHTLVFFIFKLFDVLKMLLYLSIRLAYILFNANQSGEEIFALLFRDFLPKCSNFEIFYEPAGIRWQFIFINEEKVLLLLGAQLFAVIQKLDIQCLFKKIDKTLCELNKISVITLIVLRISDHEWLLAHIKLDLVLGTSYVIARRI